tara:strand:+ start:330 stop:1250 length:921 start_codon:yes stop_codon:yes gene_type:complete
MPFKTPTSIHENIVIGHTLPALAFSYINNYPIITNSSLNTSPFDYCSPELNLSSFGVLNEITQIKTPDGSINRGISKLDLETAIVLHMSVAGLMLNSAPLTSIKIGNNFIECFSNARKYSFEFKKLHVFSCENLYGLKIEKEDVTYKVYDKINLKHFNNHEDIGYIKGKDDFVKEILIYPSQRNGAKKTDIDLLCKSYLTKEQINMFDFSDTMCRMKVGGLLKEKGLKGRKVATYKDKEYSREIALEIDSRIVVEECTLVCKEQNDQILICNDKFETLVKDIVSNSSAVSKRTTQINNLLKSEEAL